MNEGSATRLIDFEFPNYNNISDMQILIKLMMYRRRCLIIIFKKKKNIYTGYNSIET